MHFTSKFTMTDMWEHVRANQSTCFFHQMVKRSNCCLQARGRKQNINSGLLWIYETNQISRAISFAYLHINAAFFFFSLFLHWNHECRFDWQVNDNIQGICPTNTSGMIHHNNLTTAASKNTSTTNTSTTRVNFQVCLVPLPESILESSTGLRTGSESALQEQLYRFPSDWFKMSQALFCPWASTIPQLCLGGPVRVSVLSLHSSLQEACDLQPTSRCTPSQVSNAKQGPAHASCGICSPPCPYRFLAIAWRKKRRWSATPADEITTVSACILYRMQVKQK